MSVIEKQAGVTRYRPELLYRGGRFVARGELVVDADGFVVDEVVEGGRVVELPGKAMVPGFVNAHSHSFQRLIRGQTESRARSGVNFWSWRDTMYHAAKKLEPEDLYDVARMAFLEMLRAGTTTVGEFHYLHRSLKGTAYADSNVLAKQVIAAAAQVGVRIVLLRSAYVRSGFEVATDAGQMRFFESGEEFLRSVEALAKEAVGKSGMVGVGMAPHSVRAVPLPELKEIVGWSRANGLVVHMHVSEQVAENAACVREHGVTPVTLLEREGVLGKDFTAVHAIHLTEEEIVMLGKSGAAVCSCPTTERNLGDGIVPVDGMMRAGIKFALGTDSQAQIDPLEDARELEYHLRLRDQERAVLDGIDDEPLAVKLLEAATVNGARALGVAAGRLEGGMSADFFTVDLNDVSIAGCGGDALLSSLVFAMSRTAVRDVVVKGRMVVREGCHADEAEIVARYLKVYGKVWESGS